MAITYQIDPAAKLVQTKVEGRVSLEDMLSHAHLLKSDPAFRPEYSNLIDLSRFTGTDLNQDAMKAFARGFQGEIFAPTAKRAVSLPAIRVLIFRASSKACVPIRRISRSSAPWTKRCTGSTPPRIRPCSSNKPNEAG